MYYFFYFFNLLTTSLSRANIRQVTSAKNLILEICKQQTERFQRSAQLQNHKNRDFSE